MRALIFVHSPTKFAVDGDKETTEPLKRFKLSLEGTAKYAAEETEVVIEPGAQGELAPGIYATRSDGTDVQFRALDPTREKIDYDVMISPDASVTGKDDWPSVLGMHAQAQRIHACAQAQGVTSDDQLKTFFGDLQVG